MRLSSTPSRQQSRNLSFQSFKRRLFGHSKLDPGTLWAPRDQVMQNVDNFEEQLQAYPLVTAKELRHHRERPRQVKMLTREFIDGGEACPLCD